jgi:hypothetical protein
VEAVRELRLVHRSWAWNVEIKTINHTGQATKVKAAAIKCMAVLQ